MVMQGAFGGTVSWAQAPAYIIGELVGGLAGAFAYLGLSATRRQAALTSLAPADTDSTVEKIAEGTS
jgi:glycerol uptake facilitator-like aquaporin